MKTFTEQKDKSHINIWKSPKHKHHYNWSIIPEIEILPFDDNLPTTTIWPKRATKRNKVKDEFEW